MNPFKYLAALSGAALIVGSLFALTGSATVAQAVPTCNGQPATIIAVGAGPTFGTPGDDVIVGSPLNNQIFGRGGDDLICGRGGNDELHGEDGKDRVWGEDGDDALFGETDLDLLSGGNGDDYLNGGPPMGDGCNGGPGVDVLVLC
jgi:Ca2+-binding RTX toxin-like protein